MGTFLKPVKDVLTCTVNGASSATLLASVDVASGLRSGRHAIEVINGGDAPVYVGGSNVTALNGMPVAAGESKLLPVYSNTKLYVNGGSVTLVEYFG